MAIELQPSGQTFGMRLAETLAGEAVSGDPVHHPLQGLSKLGQAFVAGQMMRGEREREGQRLSGLAAAIADPELQALAKAYPQLSTTLLEADIKARPERRKQKRVTEILGRSQQQAGAPAAVDASVFEPFADAFTLASQQTGIPVEQLQAVAWQESRGKPDAVSPKNARGLMQVLPGTFAEMQKKYGFEGTVDDPAANVLAGAYYLKDQMDAFGDPRAALAAYNAGPGRVQEWTADGAPENWGAWAERIPLDETRKYVANVAPAFLGGGQQPARQRITAAEAATLADAGVPDFIIKTMMDSGDAKAPTTVKFRRGDEEITAQWVDGKWQELGRGDARADSIGQDAARWVAAQPEEVRNEIYNQYARRGDMMAQILAGAFGQGLNRAPVQPGAVPPPVVPAGPVAPAPAPQRAAPSAGQAVPSTQPQPMPQQAAPNIDPAAELAKARAAIQQYPDMRDDVIRALQEMGIDPALLDAPAGG